MDVLICDTADQAEALVAALIAARIRAKPDLVLGLATGRTMECVYHKLREIELSFAKVTTFNLDEYIGLPKEDPRSYWHYMHAHLFHHVDIEAQNIHLPDGMAKDEKSAARAYEAAIDAAGGIDLQLLGIGRTGHIGFNEPLSSFASNTRDKTLTLTTREQNAAMFGGDVNAVPMRAITMGVGTILRAGELILLAIGQEKAEILARAIEGPITSQISASAVQLHPNCKVVLDEAAAAHLENRDYFKIAMQQDPDWVPFRAYF